VRKTTIYDLPQSMVRALVSVSVPIIAALDGPAVGLGMDLALACDMRLVGAGGWMMQGWARAGLVPATGGVLLMERLAPGIPMADDRRSPTTRCVATHGAEFRRVGRRFCARRRPSSCGCLRWHKSSGNRGLRQAIAFHICRTARRSPSTRSREAAHTVSRRPVPRASCRTAR
jgi:hypothetical protein